MAGQIAVEYKITGTRELYEALEQKPRDAAKKIIRKALVAAGQIWVDDMKSRVRRGPHRNARGSIDWNLLSQNILSKVTVRGDQLGGKVYVGPAAKVAGYRLFWAVFLEFGTKLRHRGKGKAGGSTGQMPKLPFIVPAFESKKQAVLDKYISSVRETLEAEKMI